MAEKHLYACKYLNFNMSCILFQEVTKVLFYHHEGKIKIKRMTRNQGGSSAQAETEAIPLEGPFPVTAGLLGSRRLQISQEARTVGEGETFLM